MGFDPTSDYPLGSRRPDLVATPAGTPLEELTLERLRADGIAADELRATPETLRRQSAVALAAGRRQLAANLVRAAELANVPPNVLLDVYTALRPRRATADELERWAERLERDYDAPRTAEFVREARVVYAKRGLLGLPIDEQAPTTAI